MSHVVTIATEIKDLEAVKRACQRLGWKFMEGQTAYAWYGRWMDDSPIPETLFTAKEAEQIKAMSRDDRTATMQSVLGHCEHAIRIPGIEYEIGLVKKGDGYLPIWDWFDRDLHKVMGETAGPLMQAYGVEKAKIEAAIRGYSFSEQTQADGTIKLTIAEHY